MKQVTQNYKTGDLKLQEVPAPVLRPRGVLVRNHFSVISAGTEKATIEISKKGYIGKAKAKPEQVRQVLRTLKKIGIKQTYSLVMNRLNTPVPLGYSSAGRVIMAGEEAHEFQAGDRVACAGAGYASHADVIYVPRNLCVPVPESVSERDAAYSTIGAIAMQGVRQADVKLGDRVAVIGLGLIGLLTVQLLKAAGCLVIGFDVDPTAVENGLGSGADFAMNPGGTDTISAVHDITGGIGADAVIITAATRSSQPVEMAGGISRKRGKVVVVGDVHMDIPRNTYYAKELDLRLSCSYGPGRYDPAYEEHGKDYPAGYVRWTEKRNMEAFLQLLAGKRLDLERLTTHTFPFERAEDAYALISGKKSAADYIGIVLQYETGKALERTFFPARPSDPRARFHIGLIGAGNFAQATLIPALRSRPRVELTGVVTGESHMTRSVVDKIGARRGYSTPDEAIDDETVDTIVISTRHHLHAPCVAEALRRGRQVYVEKPLAMTESGRRDVVAARTDSHGDVFVGFNRRFAPLTGKVMDFFTPRSAPMFVQCRINAGFLPPEHWTQSREEGGGRIIGEVCHFVDLCRYLTGADYSSVFAQNLTGDAHRNNLSALIRFSDGSLASISYLSNGDTACPKERIEIFSGNSIAIIDDFRRLETARGGRLRRTSRPQDKGHREEIARWLDNLEQGKPIPVDFDESVDATVATFLIHDSMNTGEMIDFESGRRRILG